MAWKCTRRRRGSPSLPRKSEPLSNGSEHRNRPSCFSNTASIRQIISPNGAPSLPRPQNWRMQSAPIAKDRAMTDTFCPSCGDNLSPLCSPTGTDPLTSLQRPRPFSALPHARQTQRLPKRRLLRHHRLRGHALARRRHVLTPAACLPPANSEGKNVNF